jgi:hypothetical protein
MRRTLVLTALMLVAACVMATAALAKEMSVSLAAGAPDVGPGEPWNAQLLVHGEPAMLAEATPSITIRSEDSGETQTFAAKPLPGRATDGQLRYRATVVFPTEGVWRYTLVDGFTDREYEGGTVQVGTPQAVPTSSPSRPQPVAATDTGGFPAWPLAAGALVALALAGVGVLALRRRGGPATA